MNKGVPLFFVLALLAACCIDFQPIKAESRDIIVPDDYATIQSAVDTAGEGDRIYAKTGVYSENVRINKSISMVGEDIDGTRIIGNWSENYLRPITITCSGVTVTGFSLVDSWAGVCIDNASYCAISGNKLLNNHYGIILTGASDNTISGNLIESEKFGAYGIQLNRASNNVISGNQVAYSSEGIAVIDDFLSPNAVITSRNNSILENNIKDCTDKAVWFKFTKENLMVGNTISNSSTGLALMWTDNNKVYNNNFVNNAFQVAGGPEPTWWVSNEIRYSICEWDNDGEGNFWSSYAGVDTNHDSIGDTPHIINEKNTDNYPLMNQFATPVFVPPTSDPSFPSPTPISVPAVSTSPTTTPPDPEPFPIGQAIAIFASVMVATVMLFMFFKKSKR